MKHFLSTSLFMGQGTIKNNPKNLLCGEAKRQFTCPGKKEDKVSKRLPQCGAVVCRPSPDVTKIKCMLDLFFRSECVAALFIYLVRVF